MSDWTWEGGMLAQLDQLEAELRKLCVAHQDRGCKLCDEKIDKIIDVFLSWQDFFYD